jgi:hypothetical protein
MEISGVLHVSRIDIWSYIPPFWDFDLGVSSGGYRGVSWGIFYGGRIGGRDGGYVIYGGYTVCGGAGGGCVWRGGSISLSAIESWYYYNISGVLRLSASTHWSSAVGYPNQYTRYFRLPYIISLWSNIFSISYSSSSFSKVGPGRIDSHMGNSSGSFGIAALRRYIWNIGWIL